MPARLRLQKTTYWDPDTDMTLAGATTSSGGGARAAAFTVTLSEAQRVAALALSSSSAADGFSISQGAEMGGALIAGALSSKFS